VPRHRPRPVVVQRLQRCFESGIIGEQRRTVGDLELLAGVVQLRGAVDRRSVGCAQYLVDSGGAVVPLPLSPPTSYVPG
jgi:hypothetical protein